MTRLLYISICLRTRQDTISYSFIYIIQNSEFQDVRTENFRIQKVGIQKTGFQKVGNWNSENFRIQNRETGFQNRETGILKVGNWRLLYAIVFHWFWSVGPSPQAD